MIEQFRRDGFDFLRRAFNDPSYLEDLTGLTQMHQETLDAEVMCVQCSFCLSGTRGVLLWNQLNSRGPIFVECQFFKWLFGCNFVDYLRYIMIKDG